VDSLTGPTSALTYDFERLEILGDSFLKLISSIDVFLTCPLSNEGGLSTRRQDKICNSNLYKVAIDMSLHRYARLTPFFAKLWCPPDIIDQFDEGMRSRFPFIPHIFDAGQQRWRLVWAADERAGKRSALYHLYPDGTLEDRSKEGERVVLAGALRHLRHKSAPSNTPVLSRFGHTIPPKTMADLVESCIGALYKSGGYQMGIDLLLGLGLVSKIMLSHRNIDPSEALGGNHSGDRLKPALVQQKPIVIPSMQHKISDIAPYVPSEGSFPYEQVEEILGYKFRCRRLLFVAMTHSSVDVTNSNESLEWLGDAVLDWVITEHYYDQYLDEKWMTPARITACRQAAVCNEAFSRLAVHCGLQQYLRIDSGFLQFEIEQYVKAVMAVEDGPDAADPEGPLTALSWNTRYNVPGKDDNGAGSAKTNEKTVDRPQLTIPPAPKAIGDLFEGIAGAIFIDLGFDVDAFARVYLPLIQWYLFRHADPYDLPENPISDFWHDYMAAGVPPTAIEFRYCQPEDIQQRPPHQANASLPEKASTATCQVLVRGRLVAEATAPTKILARKFATRQAVIYIRSSGWRDFLS
jgi:endoribonuclease Dicer